MPLLLNKKRNSIFNSRQGFTLIEIIIVIAIMASLMSLTFFAFRSPSQTINIDSSLDTLIADVKQQQLKSMLADTEGSASATTHGIYFEKNKYTLFSGNYSSSNPSNFTVNLKSNLILQSDLPLSQLVFVPLSGEISGFDPSISSLTLKDIQSGEERIIKINKLGVVTINK